MTHRKLTSCCLGLSLLAVTAAPTRAAGDADLLERWFAAQTNLHTWTADAVQTRTIRTFNQPLVSTGKVFVAAPDRFRWELGQPPQTIAIRQPTELYLLYPRLKRAEKYALAPDKAGPWREALALLEASFPSSRAQLESRFTVLSVSHSNQVAQVVLQPKSSFARKFMAEIRVGFSLDDFSPTCTELKFSDGSTMRNDFSSSRINMTLAPGLFEPELPPGTSVVEPGK